MSHSQVMLSFRNALPFWASLLLVPALWIGAVKGGWWLIAAPFCTWWLFSVLDALTGLNLDNADPDTEDGQLFWYRLITAIWTPVQFVTLFALLFYVTQTTHLAGWEKVALFFGVGVMTGTIGINYSHELMHQKPAWERWAGDILLAMVLYSHFRSEHLLVHHRYVGTPRDPVTARYNQGFFRFFPAVTWRTAISAFNAERIMLSRKNRPWYDKSNPFARYAILQGSMLILAFSIGGWIGVLLFIWQAWIAISQLELVNYVEHYGLTRAHMGDGRYEHVKPRHSWNASQRASNWLLINLQRHSDHHYKPNRRFPLLQTYNEEEAPQLPYGYPVMTIAALVPPLWRRIMNPRVRAWRKQFYPEIKDWQPYNKGSNPLPR